LKNENTIRDAAPSEREGIRRRAVDEARRAIRTNPSNSGAAYDALYMMKRLETPLDLASAEDQIMSGIAASTDSPWVSMRECRFLLEVGRAADALRFCELARAIRPLAPPIDAAYARALYANGDLEKAVDAAEESMRFHPDHLQSIGIRFELAAFEGSPDRALALLHGSAPPRARLRLEDFAALELFLKARKSGAAADVDRAMTALWASRGPSLDHRYLILGAAKLGRLDDAFRALDQFGAAPPRSDVGVIPAVLLEPAAAPLWRDPRFWPVAAKAGYVRYWLTLV
jgi:tetratricopeptide (TPR) repeat protein